MANVSRETNKNEYDVIIVGAGLCGSESAALISKYNIKTLIINISMDNPGYIKYENVIKDIAGETIERINRVEGFFAKNIKRSAILHKRTENKGYDACIIDRKRFSLNYKYFLETRKNIDTRQGLVKKIKIKEKGNFEVLLNDGEEYVSEFLIISCGTFLNGLTFFGENKIKAGRHGEISSVSLAENLKEAGIAFERKSVYVPARIDGKNIEKYEKIINKEFASPANKKNRKFALSTFYKNELNDIYKNGADNIYKKYINTAKENKYPEIFMLYPESFETQEYTIENFISVKEEPLQEQIINQIYCLERVILTRPSYMIEYDGVKANQLTNNYESKIYSKLYFPGEINGTGGYAEIVYQGILSAAEIINKFYKKKLINMK
ncbi:MAG TPA: FAD-dependent oxidoreductase [Actinobacteria bacterium]|nr:FAD-dependent oxidoreductase [Actinomycetota bacterium]